MMMFLYPLRLVPLLLTLATSFVTWLLFTDIFSFLVVIYFFPLVLTVLVYFKYLFAILERIANGHSDAPVLTFEFYQPFAEIRPYQLLMVLFFVISLASQFWKLELGYFAIVLIAYFMCTLPAFIGLLGIKNGFFQSMNPVALIRFIQRTGLAYLAMMVIMTAGLVLLNLLYKSEIGLFIAIFINLYCLVLIFYWIGRIIYLKREKLDFRPDKSPERRAEKVADQLLLYRKKHLSRVFKERRRENILPVLLTHIDSEEDKLAAHAWYHSEMMQWENKRLAFRHVVFYIKALRGAGKNIIADLIEKECQAIDSTFSCD